MSLAFARSQLYEPGSNLAGDQIENVWLFLLPRLDLERVVFVGSPSKGTRTAWLALGATLVSAKSPDLETVLAGGRGLAWIGEDSVRRVAEDRRALAALERMVAAGGTVYIEPSKREVAAASAVAASLNARVHVELGAPGVAIHPPAIGVDHHVAWLVPRSAGPRLPSVRRLTRVLRRVARRPTREGNVGPKMIGVSRVGAVPSARAGEHGVLVRRSGSSSVLLPEYLRDIAREHGCDADDPGWSVALQRGYRSQKVVFHLPERGLVFKITQDPRFNHRLENEYTALRALERSPLVDLAIAPRALFAELHAGVLIVAETRLAGQPFRACSNSSPACPFAWKVLDTLTDLSRWNSSTEGGREAAEGLAELLQRHRQIHRPSARHVRFLERQIDAIADSKDGLRAVFSHGDPTTLNILVDGEDVALVDWENAEVSGLPVWDVLHFVAAYAAWSTQRSGRRWTPQAAKAALLEPSPFHSLLVRAVGRYRAATDVPADVVVPLLFTYWMVLALREATRRPVDRADGGFYARLLARAVAAGETDGVTKLGCG